MTPSRTFHASRKYAPGCMTSPIDMILTHISQKKTTVRERSRYSKPRPRLESGDVDGSSTASAALLTRMSARMTYSNFLSKDIMNTTRRNPLCGEKRKSDRCFMYTGGGSAPPRSRSASSFFC